MSIRGAIRPRRPSAVTAALGGLLVAGMLVLLPVRTRQNAAAPASAPEPVQEPSVAPNPIAAIPTARRRRALRVALWASVVLSLLLFAALALGPRSGHYQTLTVLSDSMKPAFSHGDVLVVTPKPTREIRSGDVIVYSVPTGDRRVVAHRVARVVRGGDEPVVRTKGDANGQLDPWTAQLQGSTAWTVRRVVPKAGFALVAMREPTVKWLLLGLAPALCVLFGLVQIWRPAPRRPSTLAVST